MIPFQNSRQYNHSGDARKVKKTRRSHKNSKLGCDNCKKNQIKCDESLPICNNCQRKDYACSYLFMPTSDLQQLIQLMDQNESSNVLVESTDRLFDSTLLEGYFQDKLEVEVGLNIRPPPKKRQAALRLQASKQDFNESIDSLSTVDPFLKFGTTEEQSSSMVNDGLKTALDTINYENGKLGSSLFTQFDQSETHPNELLPQPQQYLTLPDQPKVKMISFENDFSNSTDASFQLEKYIHSPQIVDGSIKHINLQLSENDIQNSDKYTTVDQQTNHFDRSGYERVGFSGNLQSSSDSRHAYSSDDTVSECEIGVNDSLMNHTKSHNNTLNYDQPLNDNQHTLTDCLPKARRVNIIFEMNRQAEFQWFDPFLKKLFATFISVRMNRVDQLFKEWGRFDIDALFEKVYRVQMNISPIFSGILRRTSLLFVYDTLKNTLCKQKSMIPFMHEEMRVAVCGLLEELSIEKLGSLTQIINESYLPLYSNFTGGQKELLFSAFVAMSGCTALHYNSGYRQSMSILQSNRCVEFLGTFTAGLFSILIDENDREFVNRHELMVHYGKHVLLLSKYLIVPNYNSELLSEMFRMLKSLEFDKTKNSKNEAWLSCYVNLFIFLEKHSMFIKLYRDHNTLLGFNRGYIVRLINEWYQIFPYDLVNIAYTQHLDENSEKLVLLHLTFLALRYYLEALVPGVRSFVKNSFIGSEKFGYDSTATLMKLFRLINKQEHQMYAIYMIRFSTFFAIRYDTLKSVLSMVYIPEFSDSEEIKNAERYNRLYYQRKYGHIIDEVQKLSMHLKNGSKIEETNYPTLGNSDISNAISPKEKLKFRSTRETITDFSKTNSGFFSVDYDPRTESMDLTSISSAINQIKVESSKTLTSQHMVSTNSSKEINSSTMRNCWAVENSIKLGM